MTGPDVLFSVIVVWAFIGSAADHWYIGRGVINKPLRYFVLGCFVCTEAYLAMTAQPAMWLYVALNVWGIINLWGFKYGRRT